MTWPRARWPALLAMGLASRLLVVALGLLAPPAKFERAAVPPRPGDVRSDRTLDAPGRLANWYHWDARWYLKVARQGYEYAPTIQTSAAFMPMLPIGMAAGSAAGLDIFWAGLIVPNLAFAIGLVGFGRMAARVTGDDGTAWRACLLLITFPTSFFFSAPYQESIGFALSAWGLWSWVDRRPLGAAVFSGLATAARLASLATSAAILAEWLDDVIRRRKPRAWAWPVAAAGSFGLICFCLYLGYRLGEPFAHFKAHVSWGREPGLAGLRKFAAGAISVCQADPSFNLWLVVFAGFIGRPWIARWLGTTRPAEWRRSTRLVLIAIGVFACVVIVWATFPTTGRRLLRCLDQRRDYLAFFLFLGLGLSAWLRRGPFWGCLILIPIGMAAMSGSPLSMTRVVLAAFPAFIESAEICGKRWVFAAVVAAGSAGQVVVLARFARDVFVG